MKIDDSVYEEGYADALIEMEALACHMCETCDCDGCCVPDDVKGLYQKIRTDAIDELTNALIEEIQYNPYMCLNSKDIKEVAKRLTKHI